MTSHPLTSNTPRQLRVIHSQSDTDTISRKRLTRKSGSSNQQPNETPPPPPTLSQKHQQLCRAASSGKLLEKVENISAEEVHYIAHSFDAIQYRPPPPPPPAQRSITDGRKMKRNRRSHCDLQVQNNEQFTNNETELSPSDQNLDVEHQVGKENVPDEKTDTASSVSSANFVDIGNVASTVTTKSSNGSWRDRVPWLKRDKESTYDSTNNVSSSYTENNRIASFQAASTPVGDNRDILRYKKNHSYDKDDEAVYVGGEMDDETIPSYPMTPNILPSIDENDETIPRTSSFNRVLSWVRRKNSAPSLNSKYTKSFDSVADFSFKESEWTPPDSSYGAAIPLGGWIPKPIRRAIEWTVIALGTAFVVYLIVMASMRVTDERNKMHNNTTNSFYSDGSDQEDVFTGCIYLDDDRYIVYDDDCNEINDDGNS